jgi:hypothetical protein
MAASINASSISNGIVASGDASGILALQGNGTTGLTINASGKLIVPNIALGTASAGMLEYDGTTHYFTPSGTQRGVVPGQQMYILNTAYTGTNATGNQSMFGLTNGVTLAANTVYRFEILWMPYKTAGTTAYTVSVGFSGTATNNLIAWDCIFNGSSSYNVSDTTPSYTAGTQTTPFAITPSLSSANFYSEYKITGTISVNAGGTFNPIYALSAAPGGAYTTAPGSYMLIYPVGAAGANVSVGTWS